MIQKTLKSISFVKDLQGLVTVNPLNPGAPVVVLNVFDYILGATLNAVVGTIICS
jgi:hypothetical protein